MVIGYDIYDCFTMEHFFIVSKNDLDDQNLLLATVPISGNEYEKCIFLSDTVRI
jgi:hypothetical protein